MMEKNKKSLQTTKYSQGYIIFILALFIGLLINISANIIYELFLKDNITAQYVILGLTLAAFIALIYTYHNKFHQPLAKFLQEFE